MGKMAEMQRKLLMTMMGAEAMGVQVQQLDWWSEKVCRNFLFGTCPHLIFGNTKMDLGPCPKTHSDKILKEFQEHQAAHPHDPRILAYKQEHENALFGFVDECDRRIRASQRKLEKTPEENRKTVEMMKEIGEIELSIQGGTEEIEALGEAGKVEESMEKLAAVDALKSLKAEKERDLQNLNETAGASGHQKLRVCETCGAMLSVLDSDKRLADHFGGKLHLGYHELRNLLAKFAEERMTARQGGGDRGGGGPPQGAPPPGAPNAPSGPRPNPPLFAPSGPSAPNGPGGLAPGSGRRESDTPHTPLHAPRIPPSDELPVVGHGDKHKREAGELVEDVKEERERESRDRSRDRYRERGEREERDKDRYAERSAEKDRYGDKERSHRSDRDRSDRGDSYDKYASRDRSSRYDDRERRDSHRDRDRERDRDRKYDDDRRREKERSRSPSKRRLV